MKGDGLTVFEVGQVAGGLLALYGLGQLVRAWWVRSLGRRRARYRALRRLGSGAQLDFFISVLREPPTIRHAVELEVTRYGPDSSESHEPLPFVESFFVQPDHVVQTLSDSEDTVVVFTVTATARSFRPTFYAPRYFSILDQLRMYRRFGRRWRWWRPLVRVKLNRTRFDRAVPGEQERDADERYASARAWVGARAWHYAEQHYMGNPGNYETFVLAVSSACDPPHVDTEALFRVAAFVDERTEPKPADGWRYVFDDGTTAVTEHGRRFRRNTAVTTWGVVGPAMQVKDYRLNFGPHGDEIRTVL
jgi:hypothetical protein